VNTFLCIGKRRESFHPRRSADYSSKRPYRRNSKSPSLKGEGCLYFPEEQVLFPLSKGKKQRKGKKGGAIVKRTFTNHPGREFSFTDGHITCERE